MNLKSLKTEEALQPKAERLYKYVDIKDRTYRFKTYKHCFIGTEAISVIIDLKYASNTDEAIEFGNELINDHLVRHVENEHPFENEELYYTFTDKFYKEKKRNTTHLTPYHAKKVSFMIKDATGFNFTPSKDKSALYQDDDDKSWGQFGSLSKSEYSFLSDRSSFAASLNTLSDTNQWIVDTEQEKEQKLDFNKDDNQNVKPFTFGTKDSNHSNHGNHNKNNTNGSLSGDGVGIASFGNYISSKPRKVSTPSLSNRHSKSSHSITFSSTVSLYTETEKRQNSLLFYDLWGIPATTRSRANSSQCSGSEEQSQSSSSQQQYQHPQQTSTSLSGLPTASGYKSHTPSASGYMSRKQSTMLSGPIQENAEEEWSDFDLRETDDEKEDDIENDGDDDEEEEYVEMEYDDEDEECPQTELTDNKISVSGYKYRKRKSTLTHNFIFGKISNDGQ